jgi:CheY-like chemotaxis protein
MTGITRMQMAPPGPAAADGENNRQDRPVVLLVTPDENLRGAAARVLGREGYAVLAAPHAGHALLACVEAGRVDVLAAELAMDDVSGPALALRLRRYRPELPALYFARPGGTECPDVLVRPFTSDDLLAALASARAGRRRLPLTSTAS